MAELGNISDYDDETLDAANEALFLWEERQFEEAEPFLAKAAMSQHSYSMPKYALILISEKRDLAVAGDLMLRAYLRGQEMAIDYLNQEGSCQMSIQTFQNITNRANLGPPATQ